MEFLLLLWDELDDWSGACRHVATSAAAEVAALSAPIATAGAALAVWVVSPRFWMNAALLGFTATFWGVYRQFLKVI